MDYITKIKFEIIINNNLYKNNIIDEETFSKVNEYLLKKIYNYHFMEDKDYDI